MNDSEFEKNALTILYRNKGVVFGGYVCDMIAGVDPKDIDVVLPSDKWEDFVMQMTRAGYSNEGLQENDATLFVREGFLNVEAIESEDSSTDIIYLGPSAAPDFDINTLAYDGIKMYNWVDPVGMDIFTIISNIRERKARMLEAEPDRITKMEVKGYTIV